MSKIDTSVSLKTISSLFDAKTSVVVTDSNVDNLYGGFFKGFRKVVLIPGEKNKNLKNIELLYENFLGFEVDRDFTIIGVGGGVVCDMTGFAASTYLRGIKFGFFPTTLLAQVDASIGGKNGVDFYGYKNIVGTFNFPEFIYIDLSLLKSLNPSEFTNGVAEVLKYGFIRDKYFLDDVVENRDKLFRMDEMFLRKVVERSIEIKREIADSDNKETGERRNLNFGHTFGHAYEKIEEIPHGRAVAAGMVVASKFSESLGYLSKGDRIKIERIISGFKLPVKIDIPPRDLFNAIKKDKKRESDRISFVFLNEIGSSFIESLSLKQLGEITDAVC
jgi:3-dehydroquinate synthase